MTYEQYWYGDPWMTRAYAQAFLLKRKIINENSWILGSYFANAMGAVIGSAFGKKKVSYVNKPFDICPKTESEKKAEIRAERKKLISWLNGMRKKSANKKNTGSDQNGEP